MHHWSLNLFLLCKQKVVFLGLIVYCYVFPLRLGDVCNNSAFLLVPIATTTCFLPLIPWCWASDGRCDVSLCECKRPCAGCNVNFSAVLPWGMQVYCNRTHCFPLSHVVWCASNAVYHVNTCVAEASELSAADINSICSERFALSQLTQTFTSQCVYIFVIIAVSIMIIKKKSETRTSEC